jgi:hypothetical protein
MKAISVLMTVVLCLVGTAVHAADSPMMGKWKLNEAESKISAGVPKNTSVVYEAAGDSVKITVDGVDADGKPVHSEWTGKFDGKDYAVKGDPTSDTRAYQKVDEHTLTFNAKKGDKEVVTGRVVVSADGKSRKVDTTGTDAKGQKYSTSAVYTKQ